MEAIVLAGGMGTRLKTVVSDVPKPMAPINGIPFLSYLLEFLYKQNIQQVVLSTGYMHETIENYFGNQYKTMVLLYSIEDEPLGTGGGIRKALEKIEGENVYIVNGDTFFDVNLNEVLKRHLKYGNDLTICVKEMVNIERYGTIEVFEDRIIRFHEKRHIEKGLINGGVYVVRKNIFYQKDFSPKFSFETEFLEKSYSDYIFGIYKADGYFIDIGIPEDYKRAKEELATNRE